MSADLRFTDRDVREDPSLTDRVLDYLEDYQGEFDFLVDCKMRHGQGQELTVGMVRGVLNCMRNDPRVTLPNPLPPAKVTPIRRRKREPVKCERTDPHHDFQCDYACEGIPWEINRERFFRTGVKVNRPYVIARYRNELVHLVQPEQNLHSQEWFVEDIHEYGMAKPTKLHVKLVCRYPSYLSNPVLLTEDEAKVYLEIATMCKFCLGMRQS